ncbi:MAG: HicB family protein [Phascolarctobacterium sp.]|nr:MAG: HicB family protein [Phascolarctobacterium sp.]
MLAAYPACFYEEDDGRYSVIFPDLNVATQGDNLNDALAMAIDCLAGYIFMSNMEKETIPPPSDIKDIDINSEYDEYKSAFINIVAVDVEEYAKAHFEIPVKKTLSIPKWLNDTAVAQKINFSNVLQKALLKELKIG